MANSLLLSGSTRLTHRPIVDFLPIQFRKSNSPLSLSPHPFNLRFTPLPPPYSVKVKCSSKPPFTPKPKSDTRSEDSNQIRIMIDSLLNTLKTPTLTLVLLLISALLLARPLSSWAASGGRMGGRVSSSGSSYSRSSGSSSYGSSSGSSSYGTSSGSGSSSYGSSSRSRSRSRSRSLYSSPSSSSYFSSSGSSSSSNEEITDEDMKAAIVFLKNVLKFIAAMVVLFLVSSVAMDGYEHYNRYCQAKRSVFKLQVGLLGTAKSLQSELNRIAKTADTSSRKGLSYILTETTVTLLRHPDYFISAYAYAGIKSNADEWEIWLNLSSIEQRGKFDEETFVNVDDKRTQRPTTRTNDGIKNEYIVVTILVVARGEHKLPEIKDIKDLINAITLLGSIPYSDVEAVEVLWTPQADNDRLSEEEYRQDYPTLKPL